MGKKLRQQRRGKGSNAYRKPPNTFKADVAFRDRVEGKAVGEVVEFIDDPGHSAPLMRVVYQDNSENILIAPEGIKIGDRITDGRNADITLGSIAPLEIIPDGMPVYNIEVTPGDGGKMVRTGGSYATVLAHADNHKVNILLPSKKLVYLDSECRAEIGAAAGGGRDAQPIIKAGKHHYMMHAINARWPGTRGVKSNPVDHPFGGKQHHKGKSSMTSRNAPPGRKVGHIAARRVGRRKRG
jgi:large subunit ribosomal protein L2